MKHFRQKAALVVALILLQAVLLFASTFTGNPAVSGDDGYDGTGFDSSNVEMQFGDSGGSSMHSYIRYPNVTIAQGSTITAATIQFTARFDSVGTTTKVKVYFYNADNPAAPTTSGEFDTILAGLTTGTAWTVPNWTGGDRNANTTTPDISAELQTVVNRGGFASGQAVIAVLQNNASDASSYARARTIDADGTGLATLSVTYTAGGSSTPHSLLLTGVGR